MFQTLQGQCKVRADPAQGKQIFKDGEKRKHSAAAASQQVDRHRKHLPHSFCTDSPVSGRGQKCSAPEGTSWPASWGSRVVQAGKFPQPLAGAFSGKDSCNADTGSPGPRDPALLPQSNKERRPSVNTSLHPQES